MGPLARILIVAAASLAPLTIEAIDAENAAETKSPVQILASPSIVPVGSKCSIHLRSQRAGGALKTSQSYEGVVLTSNDDGVSLAATSRFDYQVQDTPLLSELPYLGRHFTSTGVGSTELANVEIWIPVEEIQSITILKHSARDAKPRQKRGQQ